MKRNYFIHFLPLLVTTFTSVSPSYSHSELQSLEIKCLSKDTCQNDTEVLNDSKRSCQCDEKCTVYNDCCMDALYSPRMQNETQLFKCLPINKDKSTGFYVISECSTNWNGSEEVRK